MVGQVISLGQVIVDLTMNVATVPHAGEDVFVDGVQTQVGASFNTLYAVRRMGVAASHAGIIGTGPWASQIMQALKLHDIRHIGRRDGSRDSGFCMALTDANAERTFISTRGAEAYGEANAFDAVDPSAQAWCISSRITPWCIARRRHCSLSCEERPNVVSSLRYSTLLQ